MVDKINFKHEEFPLFSSDIIISNTDRKWLCVRQVLLATGSVLRYIKMHLNLNATIIVDLKNTFMFKTA